MNSNDESETFIWNEIAISLTQNVSTMNRIIL